MLQQIKISVSAEEIPFAQRLFNVLLAARISGGLLKQHVRGTDISVTVVPPSAVGRNLDGSRIIVVAEISGKV